MTSALSGFTLLDLSQGLCGPYAAARLGDSGMTVIKVEPLEGDESRRMGPPFVADESASFLAVNRNKRSIAVDLDAEEGRGIVQRLIASADVVLEDWGARLSKARGYDYEEIRRTHPHLVWCSISGFGERGPLADAPASELVAQAMSDYLNAIGERGAEPVRMGADVASMNTAIFASQGIAAALFHRIRTGEGQRVSVSLLGSLMHMRGIMWTSHSNPDDWYGFYCDSYVRASDRGYATPTGPVYWGLRRGNTEDWDRLLIELGMLDHMDDPRFANFGREATSIGRYAAEVKPIWEAAIREKNMGREELMDFVLSIKGDAVPFCDYPTLFSHPQVQELRLVEKMTHPTAGTVKTLRPSWTFSETPAAIQCAPPTLGQHTDEVLAASGFDAGEIGALRQKGVIK